MKKILLPVSIFSLLALTSCDPGGEESYYVNNTSSKAINIHTSKGGDNVDRVDAGQTKQIALESGIGKGDDKRPEDGVPFTVYFIVQDTSHCKKSATQFKNWQSEETGKHSRKYTFTVTDADF
jgi:hypothetical protein